VLWTRNSNKKTKNQAQQPQTSKKHPWNQPRAQKKKQKPLTTQRIGLDFHNQAWIGHTGSNTKFEYDGILTENETNNETHRYQTKLY